MTKPNSYQNTCTDQRLIDFVRDFSKSGKSIIHIAASYSLQSGNCMVFLQEFYDQYTNESVSESLNDYQRIEFEYLAKKYKLQRPEIYEKSYIEKYFGIR